MTDEWTPADAIVASAYFAFDEWCKEHDPEGEMDLLDQIDAYDAWMRAPQPATPAETPPKGIENE